MIKRIEVEVKPSGEEMAEELWEMGCDEQATFLCEVARILRIDASSFLTQLQNVADVINYGADVFNKASIVRMLETVLDYIKEAEEFDGHLISNYECSSCHSWKRENTSFCPYCGSDNRPKEGEEK